MGVELPCGNGLLALWTSLVVFVLLAFAEQVVVEIAYFYGLVALLTEVYHWTRGVKVFVSEVVVLKSFVELLTVIAEVLRILGLFLRIGLWFCTDLPGRTFLDDYFLDDSSILLYL